METERRYLNKRDLAVMTGKSRRTLDRWIEDGKLPQPHTQIGPTPVWIRRRIIDWIDAGKAASEKSA